jgi:hypothetical protein
MDSLPGQVKRFRPGDIVYIRETQETRYRVHSVDGDCVMLIPYEYTLQHSGECVSETNSAECRLAETIEVRLKKKRRKLSHEQDTFVKLVTANADLCRETKLKSDRFDTETRVQNIHAAKIRLFRLMNSSSKTFPQLHAECGITEDITQFVNGPYPLIKYQSADLTKHIPKLKQCTLTEMKMLLQAYLYLHYHYKHFRECVHTPQQQHRRSSNEQPVSSNQASSNYSMYAEIMEEEDEDDNREEEKKEEEHETEDDEDDENDIDKAYQKHLKDERESNPFNVEGVCLSRQICLLFIMMGYHIHEQSPYSP